MNPDDASLALRPAEVAALRALLPSVAADTVAAVSAEVPEYARAMTDRLRGNIESAVQLALGAFLELAGQPIGREVEPSLQPVREAAYGLGRGEARSGRSMEALLMAYRVGARTSWRRWSAATVEAGLPAPTVARFAELVFAYIDELSAASVAGHSDELATSGRVRQRYLEQLAHDLLSGEAEAVLLASAERAGWAPPDRLTVVLLPAAQAAGVLTLLDPRTLSVTVDELAGEPPVALLVPDACGADRALLLRLVHGRKAVVGPDRPWSGAATSYARAARLHPLVRDGDPAVDTEAHLPQLLLTADPAALADLRAQVLAPLADLPPATAERLAETLRAWLLHQGRREAVATALVVHPQTVRYRMTQLRERYGARLTDPESVLELIVALAVDEPAAPTPPES